MLRKEWPLGNVIIEVEPGILEWCKLTHIEWVLARLDFVRGVVLNDHGPPRPARHENLTILLQDFRSHTHGVVTEGRYIGPIVVPGLVQTHSELTEQGVFTVLFDTTFDQFFLGALGVMFGQDLVDLALTGDWLFGIDIT